jgi:hypothetical protein
MYKKYKPSIESCILSDNANFGDGKDVNFWRSKLRRINAKYVQELSNLKSRVQKLEKGEKQYVEQLFPYYVELLENIKKLQKILDDQKFVSKFVKSKKNPRRAAERKLAKTHVVCTKYISLLIYSTKIILQHTNAYTLFSFFFNNMY